MADHSINKCIHDWVSSRCRCPGPHKINIIPCPREGERGFESHEAFIAPGAATARAIAKHEAAKARLNRHEREAAERRRQLVDAVVKAGHEVADARALDAQRAAE